MLAIAGCFLTTVIYQGANMMEKARLQKTQKEIVQYALYIEQWKNDSLNHASWEVLSEDGLDTNNVTPWKRAVQEGVFSPRQISQKHRVPPIGKGAYLSVIRNGNSTALIAGAINGNKTNGPIFSQLNAERLLLALQDTGLSAEIRKENDKCWLHIFI